MPSLIYNNAVNNVVRGAIDFDTDTFWAMLTTSTYNPDKDAHDFRNDVTNEITGTGYTAGGKVITATVAAIDTANDRVNITFGPVSWDSATFSGARQIVVYKRRGGAATADELVYCQDFGADQSVSAATFLVEATTIRFQN